MSLPAKLFLFIIIALPLAFLIYTQQNSIKKFLDQTLLPKQTETTPTETPGEDLTPNSSIQFVTFIKCDVLVTDSNGNKQKVGTLNDPRDDSRNTPKFIISPSRKYLIFEDRNRETDLEIRIYSIDKKALNSLAVFGSSALLDMEFASNDKALIFYGNPGASDEQTLISYDIPALYKDYDKSLDDYGNLWTGKFEKKLPLTPVEGTHFEIIEIGKKVSVFGGTATKPVLRAEYDLTQL